MKAPRFKYFRPRDLAEALSLLDEYGDEAQVLAGGQSLMPMLNLRVASPEAVIDINRVEELSGIEERADHVRVGALTRYVELQHSPVVSRFVPLLSLAIPLIAHVAVRNRGTIGGSVILSDPAAEMPSCCVTASASMTLASSAGVRKVSAEEFAVDLYETARRPNEVLVEICFPKAHDNQVWFIDEFSRRKGDFAMVGLAGCVRWHGSRWTDPRLTFFGCDRRPVFARQTAAAIEGKEWNTAAAEEAVMALEQEIFPMESVHASSAYRKTLARKLLLRQLDKVSGSMQGAKHG